MATKDEIALEQQLANLLKQKEGIINNVVQKEFEANKQIGEYLTKKEKSFKMDQKRADLAEELLEYATLDAAKQTEANDKLAARLKQAEALNTLSQDEIELLKLKAALQLAITKGSEEEVQAILARLRAQQDLIDAREELRDIAKEDVETLKEGLGVITGFAGMVSTSTTAFGKWAEP